TVQQTLKVEYSHKVYFTNHLFESSNSLFADIVNSYNEARVKVLFIVDEGVAKTHPSIQNDITAYCKLYNSQIELKSIIMVSGGEQVKIGNQHLDQVLQGINDFNICR